MSEGARQGGDVVSSSSEVTLLTGSVYSTESGSPGRERRDQLRVRWDRRIDKDIGNVQGELVI
jgi:hypothetical protein